MVARVLDEELDRFVPGAVLLTDHQSHPQITIDSVQPHKDGLLLSLAGVGDRDSAEGLKGTSLLVTERRSLEEDEFWPDQLLGLTVVDTSGNKVGVITDLIPGEAQDRVVVAVEGADVEVPFVAALFPTVDLEAGKLVLDPPEGLL